MVKRIRPCPLASRPTVTVVIPHFNYGNYLSTAVSSALAQEHVDVDVVIVDDKSTDGSEIVAREVAASNSRIQLVEHPDNLRHIATYNDGLSRARGDYVVLLSADDALSPGSLDRSIALLEADPEIGLVYGQAVLFGSPLPPQGSTDVQSWTIWNGEEWIRHFCRRGRNMVVNPEAVMRRSVFEDIGGYDSELAHSADMFLWMQAAAMGKVGRVNGPVQAFYRLHEANMHSTDFGGVLDDFVAIDETFARFFGGIGSGLRHVHTLHRRARRSLAREALINSVSMTQQPRGDGRIERLHDFAREIAPEISCGLTWKWAEFARRSAPKSWRAGLVDEVEHMRWAIRYQRFTRWGT